MNHPQFSALSLCVCSILCLPITGMTTATRVVTDGCAINTVIISNGTEYNGQSNTIVMSEVSIANAGDVDVQTPSVVTYVAPTISLRSGFRVAQGAAFTADAFAVACEDSASFPVVTSTAQEPVQDDEDADAAATYPQSASVVINSGEKRLDRTDLSAPGRGQIHFELTRRYRSRIDFDGPLGFGWDFNYNERLGIRAGGDVVRANGLGRSDVWTHNVDGSYTPPSGYFGSLTAENDGSFVLRETNGFKRIYNAAGRLQEYLDRFGNSMLFNYDFSGNLIRVTDAFGRHYEFTYQNIIGRDRLVSVQDFTGRELVYAYDVEGNLASVRSPVITGTSTGNDFPAGRTEQYSYSSGLSQSELNHNLLTVTYPEEAEVSGPPAMTFTYGDTGVALDRVTSMELGGTNATGIPAGGTATFDYAVLNQSQPSGDPDLHRLQVTVTERNGNKIVYLINEYEHLKALRHLTQGLRPGEPTYYETTFYYDEDGQKTSEYLPEDNSIQYVYDSPGPRAAQRNLLEIRRVADSTRGGGEDLVTTMTYEPVFNQLRSHTDPRGNATSFVPPTGVASAERYTTRHFFDYQEGNAPIPDTEKYGIDLSGIPRGLGDINQDGGSNQVAGNRIRTEKPSVTLRADSQQAIGTGSTSQNVVTEMQWNDRGQELANIDAEGNTSRYTYYPENDPDGDGSTVPGQNSVLPRGYLHTSIQDSSAVSNRRTATTTPVELFTVLTYDTVGNISSRQDPRGIVTSYEHNQLNELVVKTRGAHIGAAVSSGELITGETAYGYRQRYHYDNNGRVTLEQIENRADVSATPGVGEWVDYSYTYDILDNLLDSSIEIDAATTAVTSRTYDANDLLTLLTKPEGNQVAFDYDERNLVFRIHDGFGSLDQSTSQLDYDLNGNRLRLIDAEDNDNVPGPETTTYVYDGFDRNTDLVDALGNEAVWTFDPASNIVQHQVYGHRANQPNGHNVLLEDEHLFYDELNRNYQTDQVLFLADGFAPLRPEDLRDNNSDGRVTSYWEFDALSRLTFLTEDDGDSKKFIYDGVNRPIATIDPLGNEVRLTYDANGNVIQHQELDVSNSMPVPDENFTSYFVYDQLDRVVRETDNAGRTKRHQYDSRDNITGSTDAQNLTLLPDPLSLFPGDINQSGNSRHYLYDGRDLKTTEVQDLRLGGTGDGAIDTSNPANADGTITLVYSYDGNSRLIGITDDNNNTTTYVYDDLDRKVRQINADTTELVQTFDRDSNLVTVVDPNGTVITNSYDGINRLVQRDIARAAGVTGTTQEIYAYDGLSRLTQTIDDNGSFPDHQVDRFYDSLGRIIEEQQDQEPYSNVWAGDGRRLMLVYPTNRILEYTHDAINRVTGVLEPAPNPGASLDNATIGPLTSVIVMSTEWMGAEPCSEACPCDARPLLVTMGNGTEMSFVDPTGTMDVGYSDVREIIGLRHILEGTEFIDRSYTYNREYMRVGELMADTPGLPNNQYALDSAYRSESTLIGAFGGETFTQLAEYTLDGVGNRVTVDFTQDFGGSPILFSDAYSSNEMNEYTSIGATPSNLTLVDDTRLHDDNGNLIGSTGFLYLYDYRNRLVEVRRKADNALRAHYEYDADNRRVRRTTYLLSNSSIEEERRYIYDDWHVIEEWPSQSDYDVNGPVVSYVYGAGIDQPTQMEASVSATVPGKFWYHRDARNNVVAMTDGTGSVVERTRYDDFGNIEQSASIGNRYLFQGRRYDPETGFFYFRNRYYDPLTGRFLQRDPVWDENNRGNQYTFVGNNPLSHPDPYGLYSFADFVDDVGGLFGVNTKPPKRPAWWNKPGGFNQGKKSSVSLPKGGEKAPAMSFEESAIPITVVCSATVVGYLEGLIGGKVIRVIGKTPPGRFVAGKFGRLGDWIKGKLGRKGKAVLPKSKARRLPFEDGGRVREINKTLDRIENGGPFPYKKDGTVFRNREGRLPSGNYREYTVDTPGASNRGARRIVRDVDSGRTYYTDDHYRNFVQIDPGKH